DSKETPGFVGCTIEEIQQQFFLHELARPQKQAGKFQYRKSGLRAEPGTVVLFQFAGKIIASAVITSVERFATPEIGGYEGAYYFDVNSIKIFDPVSPAFIAKIWPQVTRLGQAKWSLDPKHYAAFERKLTGVETPSF
ncbi:MAG TPA: hypothetical protein VGG61_01085, partial [Gemmataceae bacterium]